MQEIKPLTERDKKLINNWYIVCLEKEVPKNKPMRRIVYDQAFVLFRDKKNDIHCFPDRCLHRHAQLSLGDVFDGKLGCPYHGWTYDHTGQVVNIPSEDPAKKIAQNKCIRKLPLFVQDGCVWIWMGKGKPATAVPPYRFPSNEKKHYYSYFMVTDFNNEVTHLAENFMDVPHTVFVHRGWFRTQSKKRIPIKVETKNSRVLVTYEQKADSVGFFNRLLNPKAKDMFHTDCFIMPNITRVDYEYGSKNGFTISSQITPVSTLKSRVYTEIAFNISSLNLLLMPFFKFYTRQVIEQDVEIMNNQGGNFKLDMSCHFNHTDADVVHTSIERLRDMGVSDELEYDKVVSFDERVIWV